MLLVRTALWFSAMALFFATPEVCAHHNAGHGQSESLRTLATAGQDPSPRQRVALFLSAARSTDEPILNTANSYTASLLVDYRILSHLYIGAEAPVAVVDEDASSEMIAGYGDTRVGLQVPLGDTEKKTAPRFTVGAVASMPTRTFRYATDPGTQWTLTPGARYAQAYQKWLWYFLLQFPMETRPAGEAVDMTPSVGLGYQFLPSLAANAGITGDVRILSWCETVDGKEFCREGRVTEVNRPVGSVRGVVHASVSYDFTQNWSVLTSSLLPVTSRKDLEWFFSLGLEARF